MGVAREVDLFIREAATVEERLRRPAVAACFGGVDENPGRCSHFTKYSALLASLKTDAIVLRTIRYGEADRVLHLYAPDHGRIEPFFRLRLVLHVGRGDLYTVTAAETIEAYPRLREDGRALDAAARACEAVARMFDDGDPHPGVYNLLANELALIDGDVRHASRANALAFRAKLLLAAGFAPQLAGCASCGERDHLSGYSGAAGGVVCGACEASAFPLDQEAHEFLVGALGRPLAQAPDASPRALGQAERALLETLEHHAGVRLRPAGARMAATPGS